MPTLISLELARRLRDAGLAWQPRKGDRFFIPDRDLDDHIFAISDMAVDVHEIAGRNLLAFNGTVEWALDAVTEHEVVWLPSEAQLRELLGDRFVALERTAAGFRCVLAGEGGRSAFEEAPAADAYGRALLHVLTHEHVPARP